MLKKIGIGVVGAVALAIAIVIGITAFQPDTFRVERKTTIATAPSAIFPNLTDFRRFGSWSPWEKRDPNMQRTFSGPTSGTGSSYAWAGNDDVGKGRMTILDATPDERVEVKLEFLEPFESINITTYTLSPVAGGTEVAWIMEGPSHFMSKLMAMFTDMDALIGKDFEEGLSNLKRVSEAAAAAAAR